MRWMAPGCEYVDEKNIAYKNTEEDNTREEHVANLFCFISYFLLSLVVRLVSYLLFFLVVFLSSFLLGGGGFAAPRVWSGLVWCVASRLLLSSSFSSFLSRPVPSRPVPSRPVPTQY